MIAKDNSYGQAALQGKMLEILIFFISVCEKYQLDYCLAGGTCLGALRHNGFIPWDDDLDVYMPRPDYERLWKLAEEVNASSHYVLCRTSEERNYHHRVMQLTDVDTTFIHSRCADEDIEHGVYIDIIPIDARANGRLGRIEQFVDAIFFSIFNIQCKPEYNGGRMTSIMRAGTGLMLFLVGSPRSRFRLWQKAERRMTSYEWDDAKELIVLTSTFHELRTPFPRSWFRKREATFEGIKVLIPECAEEYCKKMYGDYLSLPPEEQRVARHRTEHIDLSRPYQEFKGIYYCVQQEANRRG